MLTRCWPKWRVGRHASTRSCSIAARAQARWASVAYTGSSVAARWAAAWERWKRTARSLRSLVHRGCGPHNHLDVLDMVCTPSTCSSILRRQASASTIYSFAYATGLSAGRPGPRMLSHRCRGTTTRSRWRTPVFCPRWIRLFPGLEVMGLLSRCRMSFALCRGVYRQDGARCQRARVGG